MKNLYYIFILSLLLYSCNTFKEKKVQNELYSQDFKKFKTQNELVLIDLDSIKDYSQLRKEMGKITCNNKVSGLKVNTKTKVYFLTGFASCPTSGLISCYFGRNHIMIKNDSIIYSLSKMDESIPIENLKIELDSIKSKPYYFQYDKEVLKPALISLSMDNETPISTIKVVLGEIAEQFETIKNEKGPEYFQFHILFENMDFFSIKPPPPPPPTIQVQE